MPVNRCCAWTWTRRLVRVVTIGMIGYVACVLVGMIPVNNGFKTAEEGVTIYIFSGPVHSDFIVPVSNSTFDWRTQFPAANFKADTSRVSYISIGWGDRGFYLDTPTWADLKLSTASRAILMPSRTVLHVTFETPTESKECRSVKISRSQYEKLVRFILESVKMDEDGRPKRIDHAYGRYDAFYEASGDYHAFNTCNCWVGRGLRRAGVRTAFFTPLPRTVLWYLPKS